MSIPPSSHSERPESVRLFLALWPEPPVRRALVRQRKAWCLAVDARLMQPDTLHLTLHYIGNVPRARLPELRQALAVPFTPFELCLDQPERWRHGIAVLSASTVPPELACLHRALGERLRSLDLPTEGGELRPHVTLARRAGQSGPIPQTQPPAPVAWPVADYVLVESRPGTVSPYTVLERYPAAPADKA